MDWITMLIYVCLGLAFILAGFLVGLGWNWKGFKERMLQHPKKYPKTVLHHKEMRQVYEILPKLCMEEKEIILMLLFGRGLRVVKVVDKSGHQWLEMAGKIDASEGYTMPGEDSKIEYSG